MSCYEPMIRYCYHQEYLQPGIKSKTIRFIQNQERKEWEYYKKLNELFKKEGELYEYQLTKCGQCIGCRLDNSKEWALRLILESKLWEHNWFLTLTYDDKHMTIKDRDFSPKTGEIYENDGTWNGTLVKKDIQDFMKRLRRHWEYNYNHENIRFYCGAEYGDTTERPHYHMILFNLPIQHEKLKIFKIENGNVLYTCDELQKVWGQGNILLAEVNYETCAYTARYVVKKMNGELKENYYQKGQLQEFSLMSRRPGIGKNYYIANKEKIYENDIIELKKASLKPPKYFDKLYEIDNPENYSKIKEKRKHIAEEEMERKLNTHSNTYFEQLKNEKEIKKNQIKCLKRDKAERKLNYER